MFKPASSCLRVLTPTSRFYLRSQLKQRLTEVLPKKIEQFRDYRKKYSDYEIGHLTVNDVLNGCNNVPLLFYEGSVMDSKTGVLLRGYTFQEIKDFLPKADEQEFETYEPLPENMVWLFLTGDFPTTEDSVEFKKELDSRAKIEPETLEFIKKLPKTMSPTVQLSACLLHLQPKSHFARGYAEGISKNLYWELAYEDCMDIIAKIPILAAYIYRHTYKNDQFIEPNFKLDWAGNFAHMLGLNTAEARELFRGYLSIFSDHSGGNISAHASMIVSSALSDPYLSYSAGLNGMTGCSYNEYQVKALNWLLELQKNLGEWPNPHKIKDYVLQEISEGKKIPGYGGGNMNHIDPRFLHQKAFAERYLKEDSLFYIMKRVYRVAPGLLKNVGKTNAIWPTVNASCGLLLYSLGIKELDFFSTVFGVARSLGVGSNLILSRAFGLPIERPGSITMDMIEKEGAKKKRVFVSKAQNTKKENQTHMGNL